MSDKIERPAAVEAEIAACEARGDFEQAGYLRAPGLQACTGDTFKQMLKVVAVLRMNDLPLMYQQQTDGVERWVNEQIAKEKH